MNSTAISCWIAAASMLFGLPTVFAQTVELLPTDSHLDDNRIHAFILSEDLDPNESAINGIYKLPELTKTEAIPSHKTPFFIRQDVLTLAGRKFGVRSLDSILDLSVLEKSSAYNNARKIKVRVSSNQASEISDGLAEISAAYKNTSQKNETPDCKSVSISVKHRISMDPSSVLQIVESEVSANPNCACEIVKIAIKTSAADIPLVADITEVAISAAPEQMRMISQCAIAAMPEALSAVQAVLAKLESNSGESYSSKDSKSGKSGKDEVASVITPPQDPGDPLDIPPPFPPPPPPPPNPPDPLTDPNP